MKLAPPQVVGPISECNKSVRVQGQLTGSSVLIIRNGDKAHPIGTIKATWADMSVPLNNLPQGGLKPGDRLTAIQTLGSDTSAESPNVVLVQKFDPASLNEVIFLSHLYTCSRHVLLGGLAPGATVMAGPNGARGSAEAVDGAAQLTIDPGLGANEQLAVSQVACGHSGPTIQGPIPDPPPKVGGVKSPTPSIAALTHACDRSIYLGGMVEGSEVTLIRSTTQPRIAGTYYQAAWFIFGSPPLQQGEHVSVGQQMIKCDMMPSDPSPVMTVLPAQPVPVPKVASPICAGANAVVIYGLTPGSQVRILQDGNELALAEAPASSFPITVPNLNPGVSISAQQERCGIWSNPSQPAVTVDATSAHVAVPQILTHSDTSLDTPQPPLVACADVVGVGFDDGGWDKPWTWLTVFSKKFGQISASTYINIFSSIKVSPVLQAGDKIHVVRSGCGGSVVQSTEVDVVMPPDLGIPQITQPVPAGQSSIRIQGIVPGAIVEVYLNGKFVRSFDFGQEIVWCDLGVMLQIGDHVNARQILCNRATAILPQNDVVVVKPYPLAPVNLHPNGGTVGTKPTLTWEDPGKGQPRKAEHFRITYQTANSGQTFIVTKDDTPSYTFTSDLPYSTYVDWTVVGVSSTGQGPNSVDATFTVEDQPAPPPNQQPKGPSKFLLYNCTSDRDTLFVWLLDLTANTLVQVGSIDPQYDANDTCPAAGSMPLEVDLIDGHVYQLAVVDPNLIGCGVNDPHVYACVKWPVPVQSFIADKNGPAAMYVIGP
jgi:hypothetical protein